MFLLIDLLLYKKVVGLLRGELIRFEKFIYDVLFKRGLVENGKGKMFCYGCGCAVLNETGVG